MLTKGKRSDERLNSQTSKGTSSTLCQEYGEALFGLSDTVLNTASSVQDGSDEKLGVLIDELFTKQTEQALTKI